MYVRTYVCMYVMNEQHPKYFKKYADISVKVYVKRRQQS